jgi:hypothetical protein
MITPLIGTPLSAMSQPQTGSLTITPHPSSAVGDLIMVVVSFADSASPTWVMSGGGGSWTTQVSSPAFGTGKMAVFTKPKAEGDTTYTLTQTGSDAYRIIPLSLVDWDPAYSLVIGAPGSRAASGGTTATTAPSITTTQDNSLVLYVATERTNANDNTPTIDNGFSLLFEAHTVGSDNLQAVYIAQKEMPTAGPVGATTAVFTNPHASNSGAYLIGIVSKPSTPPASGRIGVRYPTSLTHTSMVIGVDRVGGTVVEVAAKLGATEVARQTVTIDSSSGWGNASFTGLTPDTPYGFDFYVDGVLQLDTGALIRTLPTPGTPFSHIFAAGSCQFTGSNHPVWDVILADQPIMLGHMGDQNYGDATAVGPWRTAVETSFMAPRFRNLLGRVPMHWTWDNHDRIITNPTGAGTGLNLGETDPQTLTEYRKLAGSTGWATPDTGGRTWVIGRVRYIQTDQWTVRDDGDGDPAPRTFLGAAQKQWFKDTLEAATEQVIIWLCQWTGQNHANGRWNSFPEETLELEQFIDARPGIKNRMVLIGGDSHSLQVTDGTRTRLQEQRFAGIPNYNISGFNRSSDAGQGGVGWLDDRPLRTTEQLEADWGGYSRITVDDDGTTLELKWEGVRVNGAGIADIMNTQMLTFTEAGVGYQLIEWDGTTEKVLRAIEWDGTTETSLTLEEY